MKLKLKKIGFLLLMACALLLASNLDAGCPPGYDEVCATDITGPDGKTTYDCNTNGDKTCCIKRGRDY